MKNTRPEFIVGNALRVLPVLPDDCVDVVLTDPPYKDEDVICDDGLDYYGFLRSWFEDCKRIAKDYIIFSNNASRLYDIFQLLGKPFRLLVWTKYGTKYAWRWEPVFIYKAMAEPSFNINGKIWSDILAFQPTQTLELVQPRHPYQKPLNLTQRLVSFIPHDKTILDTFCGIGTTNFACQKLGRASIGIDINADYIKIAQKRCRVDIPSLQDFGVEDE